MELAEASQQLESSSLFKDWRKSHKNDFLAHAFVLFDEANADIWQLGFFNAKKKLMTTFLLEKNDIKMIPDQEILKSGAEIVPLKVDEVKVVSLPAVHMAQQLLKKEYANPVVLKMFFIVQQANDGPVYNVTFFTRALKTINIKIAATDGKILEHSESALANFS